MTEDPIEDSNQIIPVNVRNILIVCRYFVTVKISFLQPDKVRTFIYHLPGFPAVVFTLHCPQ